MKELFEKQDKEFEEKFFVTKRGILREKTVVIDGQQYYVNSSVKSVQSHISKIRMEAYELGQQEMYDELAPIIKEHEQRP